MKTIDINAKEWFDKVNGNSYFSAQVIVDWGMPTEKTFKLPFQYGYGNHYEDIALDLLAKEYGLDNRQGLSGQCRDKNIILRSNKEKNCKQRDCKAFVA